jgi:hypothetical protein
VRSHTAEHLNSKQSLYQSLAVHAMMSLQEGRERDKQRWASPAHIQEGALAPWRCPRCSPRSS